MDLEMKKKISAFFLILGATVFSAELSAINANIYLELKENEQGWFLLGLISGLKETKQPEAREKEDYDACVRGMPLKQVHAITTKYLAENPEQWHEEMTEIYPFCNGVFLND